MDGETNLMLSSEEWAAKYVFLHQMWAFQARQDLSEEEKVVLMWLEKKVQEYRAKENGS